MQLAVVQEAAQGGEVVLLSVGQFGHVDGLDAVGQGKVAHGLFLITDGQDGILAAEGSQIAGGAAAVAVGDDGTDAQLDGGLDGLLGQEGGDVVAVLVQGDADVVVGQFVLLGLGGNLGHGPDGFHGIFAVGGLAAQHEGVRTVVDGIGDVGHLGAGGARVVDHRVEHLGGHDDGFLGQDTLADEDTLNAGDALLRHLDAQVATGYHHAVGHFEDFVDIVHALLVLYLGDDADVAALRVENLADVQDVLAVAHEGVGDEVDVAVDGIVDVAAVALGQRRQVDAHAGHVDTLPAAQGGLVLHLAEQGAGGLAHYGQLQVAVVDEDVDASIDVAHKVGIADGDALAGGLTRGVADNLHTVARMEVDGLRRHGGTHLGALGVHQDGDAVGDGARVVDELVQPLEVQMRGIEADDVHPGLKELAYKIHLATLVGDGGYNLGLFQ